MSDYRTPYPYLKVEKDEEEKKKSTGELALGCAWQVMKLVLVFVSGIATQLAASLVFMWTWNWVVMARFSVAAMSFKDALACVLMIATALLPLNIFLAMKDVREHYLRKGDTSVEDPTNWSLQKSAFVLFIMYPITVFALWLWSIYVAS